MEAIASTTNAYANQGTKENSAQMKNVSMTVQTTGYAKKANVFVRTDTSERIAPSMNALTTVPNTVHVIARQENARATLDFSETTVERSNALVIVLEKEPAMKKLENALVTPITKAQTVLKKNVPAIAQVMGCVQKTENANAGMTILGLTVILRDALLTVLIMESV